MDRNMDLKLRNDLIFWSVYKNQVLFLDLFEDILNGGHNYEKICLSFTLDMALLFDFNSPDGIN